MNDLADRIDQARELYRAILSKYPNHSMSSSCRPRFSRADRSGLNSGSPGGRSPLALRTTRTRSVIRFVFDDAPPTN